MSGWERPTPPGESPPRTYWTRSSEADPLSPGQLIRRGWRLYRVAPRRFLLVAAVSGLIRDLLAIPSLIIVVTAVTAMVDVMGEFLADFPGPARFVDPRALELELQAQLEAVMAPSTGLAVLSAVGGGFGIAVSLVGASALTAAALATMSGRPISVGDAYRAVAARRDGLLKPMVALGVGWVAVAVGIVLLQASPALQAWIGTPGSPRNILIDTLLNVLAVVVTITLIVLVLRWALCIPAVLVEALGLRAGLTRSAALTSGIRIRLALAMTGILILESLSVGIVAAAVGFGVGLSLDSFEAGLVSVLIVSLIGNLLWSPVVPAMLALAYRERTRDASQAAGPLGP